MFFADLIKGAFIGHGRVQKKGEVALPSSIDVRPMEESGENAYAQMGLGALAVAV